jgi:hypothetical protein
MPKKIHLLTTVLFAAFGVAQLPAQLSDPIATDRPSDEPQQMVVNYGEDQETSVGINGGVMDPVGLLPDQVATMTVTFPSSWAGMPVTLGRLDGGVVVSLKSRNQVDATSKSITRMESEAVSRLSLRRASSSRP